MYKVVLIDDENKITRGLKQIIQWERLNCTVVGVAYNGQLGLQLVEDTQPDIVITDINMPYMDGLEMIEVLKRKESKMKFIILSGYSDFQYAQKGIRLGINNFILKPVDEQELEDSIQQATADIEHERREQEKLTAYQTQNMMYTAHIQEYVLRDTVLTSMQPDEISELLQYAQIDFKYNYFTCCVLMKNHNTESVTTDEKQILSKLLSSEWPEQSQIHVFPFRYSDFEMGIVVNHSELIHWQMTLQGNINDPFIKKTNCSLLFGVGQTYLGFDKLHASFEEAKHALGYSIVNKQNSTFLYDPFFLQTKLTEHEPYISFLSLLEKDQYRESLAMIDPLFDSLDAMSRLHTIDLQMVCLNMILAAVRRMTPWQIQQLYAQIGVDIISLGQLSHHHDMNDLKQKMRGILVHIHGHKEKQEQHQHPSMIQNIKQYMDKHCAENISLVSMAEHFFINPSYLSQIFKKKTNDTFLNYLTKIRIEKAKCLLLETDLKVYEISDQVGYKDPKYFSKIFEKYTGIKPSDFKTK